MSEEKVFWCASTNKYAFKIMVKELEPTEEYPTRKIMFTIQTTQKAYVDDQGNNVPEKELKNEFRSVKFQVERGIERENFIKFLRHIIALYAKCEYLSLGDAFDEFNIVKNNILDERVGLAALAIKEGQKMAYEEMVKKCKQDRLEGE